MHNMKTLIIFLFLDYPYNDPQFKTALGHCNNALGKIENRNIMTIKIVQISCERTYLILQKYCKTSYSLSSG